MLTTGKNTYVTVEEADDIVRLLLRPSDPFRVYWLVLTEDEKEGYLLNSVSEIEALPFTGKKFEFLQIMQFPRETVEIPEKVKQAQVFNALGFMNADLRAAENRQMNVLQSLGAVKNFKYNKRESMVVDTAQTAQQQTATKKLQSARAYELLKPYLCGAFRIS